MHKWKRVREITLKLADFNSVSLTLTIWVTSRNADISLVVDNVLARVREKGQDLQITPLIHDEINDIITSCEDTWYVQIDRLRAQDVIVQGVSQR